MIKTRSSQYELLYYDPEIKRTLRRIRKEQRKIQVDLEFNLEKLFEEESNMAERTLKELGAPKLDDEPLCIVFPTLERPLKLNSGFFNLLHKFYGNAGEDPHRHLKEFIVVCSTMKPEGINQDHIRIHAFPFSLHDLAKDWLYSLSPGSLTTWEALQKAFLEKFFPASRIGSIRKEICGIRQHASESLYEYWERFKRLCASCPQHQISDQLLIQYFYEGLLPNDRGMIDAASGGALVDKTPTQAKELISNMAQNTQQHSVRNDVKRVNEIDLSGVKSQLQENAQQIATLTTLVSKLVGNESKARVCGICSDLSHPTDACPTLQTEDVNALGGFPGQPQRKYDPFSSTYNEGWRDHPNLKYGPKPPVPQNTNPRPYVQQNFQPALSNSSSLEGMVKNLATQIGQVHNQGVQYQQKTDTHLQNIDTQIGQICTSLSNLESQLSGKLPSQPHPNPKEQVNRVILKDPEEANELEELEVISEESSNTIKLLDAINVVPKYQMLFEQYLSNNDIHDPNEFSKEWLSSLPVKCKDPGSFSIPYRIGKHCYRKCMLDLGSSVNILPYEIYMMYEFDSLQSTNHTLALSDNTEVKIVGVLNNALIRVKNIFFLDDFYVIDTKNESTILLGRPFLKTSKALIDVANGSVVLESNGEKIELNMIDKDLIPEANATNYVANFLSRLESTIWKQYLMEWLPKWV
ncbi:DNA damage-inducible protein 1 [Bienertia sinuspersici]